MKLQGVYILLFIIVLIGGVLRVNVALRYSDFSGDPGRDVLVARHIALYQEYPQVGHTASGIYPAFYYPPYYYYLLGLLYRIVPQVWFISLAFAVVQTLSIVVIFLIGEQIADRLVGLFTAMLYALCSQVVWFSNCITAVYMGTPLFFLAFLLLLLSVKERMRTWVYIASLLVLLLSSTIAYASLVFVPYFLLLPFVRKKHTLVDTIYYGLFLLVVFMWFYAPLIFYFQSDFWLSFSPFNTMQLYEDIGQKIIYIINLIQNNLFSMNKYFLFIPVCFYVIAVMQKRCDIKKVLFMMVPIVWLIGIGAIKHGPVYDHYFTITHPFVFMLMVYPIAVFWQTNRHVLARLLVLAVMVSLVYFVSARWNYFAGPNENGPRLAQIVANVIPHEVNTYTITNYQVKVSMGEDDGWTTPSILYFLETTTGNKYVRVINYNESVEQTSGDDYLFWICKDYEEEEVHRQCYIRYVMPLTDYKLMKILDLQNSRYAGYLLKKR